MRKLISVILTFMFVLQMLIYTVAANEQINIRLNGNQMYFDTPPQMVDDRVLVPMRSIFEAFNSVVSWDEETNTISAYTKNGDIVLMQIGRTLMFVNNSQIALDVPPQIINDATFVPVRAVSESLNASVVWDEQTNSVYITTLNTGRAITEVPNVSNNSSYLPLHLYSNDGKKYLGKLTLNKFDVDSVWNQYGTYGNKYGLDSIWNQYGTYGSPYSIESAFNKYATKPPEIVDNKGNFLWYLTDNEYISNGYTIEVITAFLRDNE